MTPTTGTSDAGTLEDRSELEIRVPAAGEALRATPSRGRHANRRRWLVFLSLLLALVVLPFGIFWPWFVPGGRGYVRQPANGVIYLSERPDVSKWRGRAGDTLIRVTGVKADTGFQVNAGLRPHGVYLCEPWAFGPWLVIPRNAYFCPLNRLPDATRVWINGGVAEMHCIDGDVRVRLRK